LIQLTRKDQEFRWTTEKERAFGRFKSELSSETVLVYLSMDPGHEFQLHTDASDQGISAVLTHIQNGQEMRGPTDRDLEAYTRKSGTKPGVKEQVAKLAQRIREARRVARENIRREMQGQRARHDKRAVRVSYNPGQLVYRKKMVRGRKLEPRWLGPYPVVRRVSDLVYMIRIGSRETNVNVE
jgi:hypothetical protein